MIEIVYATVLLQGRIQSQGDFGCTLCQGWYYIKVNNFSRLTDLFATRQLKENCFHKHITKMYFFSKYMFRLVVTPSSGMGFHLTPKQCLLMFVVLWKQPLKAFLQNRCSANLLNILEKILRRPATLLKLNSFTDILQGFC